MNEIVKAFATGTEIKVNSQNILDFLKLVQEETNIKWDVNTNPLDFNPFSSEFLEEYCVLSIFGREKWICWSPVIKNDESNVVDFEDSFKCCFSFDKSITDFLAKERKK